MQAQSEFTAQNDHQESSDLGNDQQEQDMLDIDDDMINIGDDEVQENEDADKQPEQEQQQEIKGNQLDEEELLRRKKEKEAAEIDRLFQDFDPKNMPSFHNSESEDEEIKQDNNQIQKQQVKQGANNQQLVPQQNQEEEEDDQFELLCNQVEAEQVKDQRQKDVKKMQKKLQQKYENIKQEKLKKQETEMVLQAQGLKEKYTGLIFKNRLLNEEDVDIFTRAREFIPIETLDTTILEKDRIGENKKATIRSFFSIGVLVDVSGPFQSKSNKRYTILRVTDLVKYNMSAVKKELTKLYEGNPEGLKIAEKSFNSNGYKTIKLMAFEDAIGETTKIQQGTIVGLVNPKPMKATVEYGYSFCIDASASIFRIGYSQDFIYCPGKGNMTTSGFVNPNGVQSCKYFLNKSVEPICDIHRNMAEQRILERVRSHRNNMMSEAVDVNQVTKRLLIEERERRIGAFNNNGMRQFRKGGAGPKQHLSPKSQKILEIQKQKEKEQFDSFMKDRAGRAETKKIDFFNNIRCKETQMLGKGQPLVSQGENEKPTTKEVNKFMMPFNKQQSINMSSHRTQLQMLNQNTQSKESLSKPPVKEEDEDEFELEFVGGNKSLGDKGGIPASTAGFSLKNLLGGNLKNDKKSTFSEKFGNENNQIEANNAKRFRQNDIQ
ncbi:UNKNOWN [Stylonychia lemnae]|uniref:Zinc finger Mcm10/DnaG-type domain-containing protein n=1 Tax=Stylonychia lemnae TaxID=5949 RepID=A0A078A9K4_STYLE|nr:UNKNOWN [Stylonychia lemnae]|eukprot:CDW78551.1 UNKNOWN [Stylonychia lemnae]